MYDVNSCVDREYSDRSEEIWGLKTKIVEHDMVA